VDSGEIIIWKERTMFGCVIFIFFLREKEKPGNIIIRQGIASLVV
jgi:hypothetical protein